LNQECQTQMIINRRRCRKLPGARLVTADIEITTFHKTGKSPIDPAELFGFLEAAHEST